jgi:hypothetical protein
MTALNLYLYLYLRTISGFKTIETYGLWPQTQVKTLLEVHFLFLKLQILRRFVKTNIEAGHSDIPSLLSKIIMRHKIIKLTFLLGVEVHNFRFNNIRHAIFVCGKGGGLFNFLVTEPEGPIRVDNLALFQGGLIHSTYSVPVSPRFGLILKKR